MHAQNADERVDILEERLRRISSLIRVEATRNDVKDVYRGLVVTNLSDTFVTEALKFANITKGRKEHNKKRQLVVQLTEAIVNVVSLMAGSTGGSVRANLLFAEFDLNAVFRVYANPSNTARITQAMKQILSSLNDQVGGVTEYEALWKSKMDKRERIAFGKGGVEDLTSRLAVLDLNEPIGTVDEDVNTLADVLKLSGVTADVVPAGTCSFSGLESVLKQDRDLLTNSGYARSFVALCISAAVGVPPIGNILNDKYSLQIRAKACYALHGRLAMKKFALMGHVIILHGPKTAELEAVREWLGAKSLWSARTGPSRASKSIAKIQRSLRREHPYDAELAREIYATIVATLDPTTLS